MQRRQVPDLSVSGLMIVSPGQESGAIVSAWDFIASEGSQRELIIVGDQAALSAIGGVAWRAQSRRVDMTLIETTHGISEAEKYLKAITASRGRNVCIWHATDRHAQDYLSRQLESIATTRSIGAALSSAIYYFPHEKKSYLVDFRVGSTTGTGGFIPATLCVRREVLAKITEKDLGDDPDHGLFEFASRCGRFSSPPDAFAVYLRTCAGRGIIQARRKDVDKHGLRGNQIQTRSVVISKSLRGFGLDDISIHDSTGAVIVKAEVVDGRVPGRRVSPRG